MMSKEAIDCFDSLQQSIAQEVESTYLQSLKSKERELAARGLLRSGAHLKAMDTLAAEAIHGAGPRIVSALEEANASEPPDNVQDRADQLASLVEVALTELVRRLTINREAAVMRLITTMGGRPNREAFHLDELPATADRVLMASVSRARLAAKRAFHTHASAMTSTTNHLNFNAPVGAVQTGANSVANVVQSVGGPSSDQILAALAELRRAIEGLWQEESHRADALEIVEQLETQARKDKPNKITVTGLVGAASSVMQGLAAAPGAWQTILSWSEALRSVS